MTPNRGLTIHFNDGTSLTIEFPEQAANEYARTIMQEEILKRRMLTVEAEGALLYIPFENIKYLTVFPAPEQAPKFAIRGASIAS
jgi:hypothetical protein